MELIVLKQWLMWCTIINGSLLGLWTVLYMVAPERVYRTQKRWFPMSRETFNLVFYAFLGLFKIVFIVFNLTPWLALLLVSS